MIIPKNWGEMPFTARLDFLIRVILLLFGAGLAINQFLFNRSIWGDEGYLALNIIDKSYFELLGPLDHYQVSPPLFLILSKFFFRIIPQPEMALRFLPLIFFISSLVLLFFLTQRLFETPFTRIATLSLFSFSHAHIYFATEFKQYIGDVFFVLLGIYLVLFPFRFQKVKFFSLGLYGAFFCLFSHSSFLFLPTLTLYLIVEDYSEDSRENLKPIFFLAQFGFQF
ncbi:MAG: glycosyltransferase family 39 protein [Chloroherpetonaceae bacterium]|nr:glycosyltransferase family 39 protein [Chloroherpetonaceae bacterium]